MFSQISFLLNDPLHGTWELIYSLLVVKSCFSSYHDMFKINFFLILSNHPLLAFISPALDHSLPFNFSYHKRTLCVRAAQFSSVAQLCLTLCNPTNCSTPGLPVHHQLLDFTQTHIHQVGDAIQPSHPLLSPFPPAPNPSQHQSLFQ